MSKPLMFHSIAHVDRLLAKAFNDCHSDKNSDNPDTQNRPYTMTRIALELGIDRRTLIDWEQQVNNYVSSLENIAENRLNIKDIEDLRLKDGRLPQKEVDGISASIKKAKQRAELYIDERLNQGTGNVIGPIFVAKNNFEWADKTEIHNINEEVGKNTLDKEDKEDLKAIADLLSARKRERQASNVVPIRKQVVNS